MKVIIESAIGLSDKERETIKTKVEGLSKYEGRVTEASVYFKKDDGNIPNGILAEIRLHIPGDDLFAEDVKESAMQAMNSAYNAVKRQLKKRRDKLNDHQSPVKELRDIVNDNF